MLPYQILNLVKYLPHCTRHHAITSTYFEYIVEKHKTVTDNPPIRIHLKKIKTELR